MRCPSCHNENPNNVKFCAECGAELGAPDELAASSTSTEADAATGSDFVGRHREMGVLLDALDDVLTGEGRVVVLSGEPGIGKTRTAGIPSSNITSSWSAS